VRIGIDGYESDATKLSVNLVKRFGTVNTKSATISEQTPAPVAEAPVLITPVVAKPMDSDKDGITDKMDKCANSPSGRPVDANGCTIVSVVLENVIFESGSAKLAEASYASLDKAVDALNNNPELRIEIQAHTDSMGAGSFNQRLSGQRADSVRTYMIDKGIASDRLIAKGYGESQPIADNGTQTGRATNRRVELKIIE
jgi:OmpA-OmpF porin, OOP family